MKKGSSLFMIACFFLAVAFYKVNPFISIVFFVFFLGIAFSAGKLG